MAASSRSMPSTPLTRAVRTVTTAGAGRSASETTSMVGPNRSPASEGDDPSAGAATEGDPSAGAATEGDDTPPAGAATALATASRSANRRTARAASSVSTPRSKRCLASEVRPRRVPVRATPMGKNHAASRRTEVVSSEISLLAPPMIPATPTGWEAPSQISRSSAMNRRSTPSRVTSVSSWWARRTMSPRPARRSRS
jgi:hypothetical protein